MRVLTFSKRRFKLKLTWFDYVFQLQSDPTDELSKNRLSKITNYHGSYLSASIVNQSKGSLIGRDGMYNEVTV